MTSKILLKISEVHVRKDLFESFEELWTNFLISRKVLELEPYYDDIIIKEINDLFNFELLVIFKDMTSRKIYINDLFS